MSEIIQYIEEKEKCKELCEELYNKVGGKIDIKSLKRGECLFFVGEIATVGFLIFWFGIGALIAMIVSFFTSNIINLWLKFGLGGFSKYGARRKDSLSITYDK